MEAKPMRVQTKRLTVTALLAAILCVCAPWALPVGAVPVTLATFGVYLAASLVSCKHGVAAVAVYLLLGAAGLPVFSGFRGGIQCFAGPTGGYLLGYLPCALLTGLVVDRRPDARWAYPAGMALGTLACYLLGTAWFVLQTKMGVAAALGACVLPFLPGDAAKIAAASFLSYTLRKALARGRAD